MTVFDLTVINCSSAGPGLDRGMNGSTEIAGIQTKK